FELAIQILAIAGETRLGFGVAKRREQTCRMPGRSRGELCTLQQDHLATTELGEVIRNRATDHSAADDDDACPIRESFVDHLRYPPMPERMTNELARK